MTNKEFNDLKEALVSGDNTALDSVFRAHYQACVAWLQKKYNCEQSDAEDLFMDALLVFRKEVIQGRVTNKNIRAYLITVAKNIFLQRKRKKGLNLEVSVEEMESIIGKEAGLYDESFNPILKAEVEEMEARKLASQYKAFQLAWEKLGEPCKKVLKGFYIDKIKLKELQIILGYSSYDSIKSIRRRCFNQLKEWASSQLTIDAK